MRSIIYSDKAPEAVGPYSQAIQTDDYIFTSAQIPIDPSTGELVEGGLENQVRQVMENLESVLTSAGSNLLNIVKTTVYLNDMKKFQYFNEIYARYFPSDPPARSAVQVAALPKAAMVAIDVICLTG